MNANSSFSRLRSRGAPGPQEAPPRPARPRPGACPEGGVASTARRRGPGRAARRHRRHGLGRLALRVPARVGGAAGRLPAHPGTTGTGTPRDTPGHSGTQRAGLPRETGDAPRVPRSIPGGYRGQPGSPFFSRVPAPGPSVSEPGCAGARARLRAGYPGVDVARRLRCPGFAGGSWRGTAGRGAQMPFRSLSLPSLSPPAPQGRRPAEPSSPGIQHASAGTLSPAPGLAGGSAPGR